MLITLFCSCKVEQAPKQYFQESPEIEVCKKALDAYLKQDWTTFRSCYDDTARVWRNSWVDSPGIPIDSVIAEIKGPLASSVYYRFEGNLWEMIINNQGYKWVHFWGQWVGKIAPEAEEVKVPVHMAYGFNGDKISQEMGVWDNLPLYLAQQALKKPDK